MPPKRHLKIPEYKILKKRMLSDRSNISGKTFEKLGLSGDKGQKKDDKSDTKYLVFLEGEVSRIKRDEVSFARPPLKYKKQSKPGIPGHEVPDPTHLRRSPRDCAKSMNR